MKKTKKNEDDRYNSSSRVVEVCVQKTNKHAENPNPPPSLRHQPRFFLFDLF